jgi:membrane-associated protein
MGSLITAAIVGDQVGYIIGRTLGRSLFQRPESRFFKPKYLHQTKAFYDRHGGKTIIIGRFIPIVRTFAPVVAGAVELEYKRFVTYNIVGGIIWIVSMLSLGYFIGILFKPYVSYITLGIIVVSVLPVVHTLWQERRRSRQTPPLP